MVEGEPESKHNDKCDVKDERPNGCGSKELELARIGPKDKNLDPEKGSCIKADFEKAIELTEYGKFHYFLLAVCGFVSTSEEMDVISMSFILPSAQCDLKLDTQAKGWLNSIIFIGMMAGAYAWGSVADALGRRKVLIAISFMNALCIVASSFSQSYELFMFFRFLNGAALGGSGPVIWSYFAEFQPKSKRGSMLSFMAAFWTLGNLFVAGLAWLIIPQDIGITSIAFTYNSWRIFLLICAAPSFIVAGLLLLLPESPKYLLSCGRYQEALDIFRGIYAINTGRSRDSYTVKELILDDFQEPEPVKADIVERSKCKMMLGDILDNSRQLFVSPILRFTVVSIIINFTFHIGYYGLMMWFPELFNRFDEFHRDHPGQSTSICEVTDYVVNRGSHRIENVCNDKIGSSVFMESLITVASAIPANIVAVLGMDRLGRKFFLVFSTLSSGLCSIGLYFVYNKYHNLIVSAFFSGVISCGNAALDCLITEVFPTHLRATGIAISMVAARLGGIIGNIVIAQLLDMYCPAPTFIVAGLLIGGGLLCLFLPNTTREPLS
ncbi:PREDICTED: synaptic vesicle glycoprotein 2B [Polistes dominula]|uniref:Synaptic vesicle glycoprotein 2B n=1 Tax=Polistes dominula TaxID=743375 RepID=A0ABM1I6R7_POLDO|nr:PREDICTED: synaptic vesicle glycoprotein 2B [Polistes dominula]XP_015175903.1 PREDICTED: synaptic vesicle glycoprotein 2B [Polistes dominula]XP_015175904.1 PREDICTED: synaptic vesicle glycoprotein 2B [Polistes dominula]XP_015175905.1 PREDICTED: synaptic vesicle glycoprotein 2B [Polistes dominula]XP_015175906.1 PREDICTED: synaptic vesicle glycoprotein 2B [Polistes dominula]